MAGSVNYCVKNAGIRASVGNAQCELLFVPLAVVLHCCTHAFVRQGQRLHVGSWDELGELGCELRVAGAQHRFWAHRVCEVLCGDGNWASGSCVGKQAGL